MKLLLAIIMGLFTATCFAQDLSDVITVTKKNGRHLKTFQKNSRIDLLTHNGSQIAGVIQNIENDTVYITQYVTRELPTQFGTKYLDTLNKYIIPVLFKEIKAVEVYEPKFSRVRIGSLLQLGGGGYIILNLVNGLYLKTHRDNKANIRKNLQSLGIGAAAFATGLALNKFMPPKKYSKHKDVIVYTAIDP